MNVPKLRFKEFNESYNIKELNEITYNVASGKISKPVEDGNYNIYGSMGKIGTSNFYDYEGEKVLVARVGANAGSVNKINEKCCISDNTLVLEPKDVLNDYLYYSLKHYNPQKLIFGSGQPLVTGGQLKKIKLGIPREKEQLKVANFLSLLDKKIELQTKKIEDLKLFTFNTIKDLYNDAKCDTIKIQDIATFYSGGTPTSSNKEFYSGTIPFIRSGEIHSCKTELYINEDALIKSSAKMISKGDILYALYGATSGDVSISKITGAINQAILCIKPNNNINKFYLYQVLKIKKEEILKKYLQGGQGNLSAEIIKNILIKLPSPEFQNSISKISNDLEIKLEMEIQKLNKLIELKKGLMQNMFV